MRNKITTRVVGPGVVVLALLVGPLLWIPAGDTPTAPAKKPPPENRDENKVQPYQLPDPLLLKDGQRVADAATWTKKRRPEVLELFRSEMFGRRPSAPAKLKYKVFDETRGALGGKAIRKQVTLFFSDNEKGPRMDLLLYIPANAKGPVPAFLGLNFGGNQAINADPGIKMSQSWQRGKEPGYVKGRATEASRGASSRRWDVNAILDRGYALATAYYGDIDPDYNDGFKNGVHPLFYREGQTKPAADEWGSIAAWAWGLSRALDYLEKDAAIDAKRVAVMGHSRLGKTALWAGAEDERFAIVISNDSGCGGAKISRRNYGESVHQINYNFPHWFCDNFKKYNERVNDLPFDQHMLIALMAPRPVYVASADQDRHADPRGEFLAALHAESVYRLFGASGLGVKDMPSVNQPKMGTIGYHLRAGVHDVTPYDWKCYLDFADRHFVHKSETPPAPAPANKAPVSAAEFEIIDTVEKQPLVSATERLIDALQYVGSPLPAADLTKLKAAMALAGDRESVKAIQNVLDPLCLAQVTINAESRVSAVEGKAPRKLTQQGWSTFLVKVNNKARITPRLIVSSPQAERTYEQGKGNRQKPQTVDKLVTPAESAQRFLDVAVFDKQPLKANLSGLEVEYRIVQLYSRDAGRREATLSFHVGQGTQDLGFRSEVPILFECAPAVKVVLGILDHDGKPTTAAIVVRDRLNRVYPNPARRLSPDFFFHNQVYRADGESISLPPGEYTAVVSRGPEYLVETHRFSVPGDRDTSRQTFQLKRWIEPKKRGWYSGDHHVHAAGCAHYDSPTEGVGPADMMRHILGEDLNVGCVLSWGPCWYTQKKHFEGKTSDLSQPNYLMRYDVEVSGFPSSHAGHLCLLRLKEDDYPGTRLIEEWPSWTLPVLKWGQQQGGVVGYSHSGWGLAVPDYGPRGERLAPISYRNRTTLGKAADKLPDYALPPFDGIGANEYIVATTHGVCDFISAVDTPAIWELNIWYHTLNCGMTSRISGETDFPCIYGDKVGLGRIYVKMPADKPLDFDAWARGLKDGRSYCGDGLSHVLDFKVNNVAVGEPGSGGKISTLDLAQPGDVNVTFDVAALLEKDQTDATRRIRKARLDAKPYWHLERCRVGDTRKVPVEVIVNGEVASRKEIEADGSLRSLTVPLKIKESSWVAVRILPSVHTNPVWVTVGGKPVRASKRSAEWCIKAVDQCWKQKVNQIRKTERAAAKQAYDEARTIYQRVLAEATRD